MAYFKTRRQHRYNSLRARHLTPIEAREFSKMPVNAVGPGGKVAPNPTIRKILQERGYIWSAFRVEALAKGWGITRRKQEWKTRIVQLYSSPEVKRGKMANWIVTKDIHGNLLKQPTISPWEYYDSIRVIYDYQLWDTPRTHRRRTADVSVDLVQASGWIHDLNKKILGTTDPVRKAQLSKQRQNLRRLFLRRA